MKTIRSLFQLVYIACVTQCLRKARSGDAARRDAVTYAVVLKYASRSATRTCAHASPSHARPAALHPVLMLSKKQLIVSFIAHLFVSNSVGLLNRRFSTYLEVFHFSVAQKREETQGKRGEGLRGVNDCTRNKTESVKSADFHRILYKSIKRHIGLQV